ncbi:unnamed protein product [Anisakis simplex]|uniref:Serine beta-lactamase-like protein LACTB, mitochondrial (inferred by orthology to a human protein) n=1 Tax=Anisakis simplex TaxID=6269 RepID=A0A0M3KH69_ANISI|nr:unnamed protein product [Anisakis simplex]
MIRECQSSHILSKNVNHILFSKSSGRVICRISLSSQIKQSATMSYVNDEIFKEDREEIEPDVKTNEKKSSDNNKNNNKNKKDGDISTSVTPEFLSNKSYESVEEALEMFKNDALISKPGTEFNYSTHGYTLLSAVLEKAAKTPFKEQAKQLFNELGMNHTVVDQNEQIMPNRARYYYRDRHHKLKNVPEVDNSYKWAGGGFLSNVNDLLIFANAMLYSFHHSRNESQVSDDQSLRPLLERDALKTFWEGEVDGKHGFRYGLGWYKKPKTVEYGGGNGCTRNGFWMHTGAAVGASSVLVVKPNFNGSNTDGVCVAVLVNLHDCKNVTHLALELAEIFEKH